MHIFNNEFLPSHIGVFYLSVDEPVSANFGRFISMSFAGPNKARLQKNSRAVSCLKGLNIVVNILLLLTSVERLRNFFRIVSLKSLMVTNDLQIGILFTDWILRTNWTPDCFVSGKIDLLKIIKKNVILINIIKT